MENGQLQQYIDKIERLNEQVDELKASVREVYSEAKGAGFDIKALREVIKLRKLDPADRQEFNFLRDEYSKILGL